MDVLLYIILAVEWDSIGGEKMIFHCYQERMSKVETILLSIKEREENVRSKTIHTRGKT